MFWYFLYFCLGSCSGVLAGLLGIGGGTIVVITLSYIFISNGMAESIVMQTALATTMTSMMATTFTSAYQHWQRNGTSGKHLIFLLPGLLAGSILGTLSAQHLHGNFLRIVIGIFCFIMAWRLYQSQQTVATHIPTVSLTESISGIAIGFVSALVGIGGGTFTVPLLIKRNLSAAQAIGTSAACGFFIAVASAVTYMIEQQHLHGAMKFSSYMLGHVYLPAAFTIAAGSVLATPYGVRLAYKLPHTTLRYIFSLFLCVMGLLILEQAYSRAG